jgi:hypothetical protein
MIAPAIIHLLLLGGATCPADTRDIPVTVDTTAKHTTVELHFNKGDGKMITPHESPDHYTWGARAAGHARLQGGTTLRGQINYTNHSGKNTGGATFIDPANAPFTLVETPDTNRGTRSGEQYTLAGSATVPLHPAIDATGGITYKTAHRAKHADPRHKNTLLDMTVDAGIAWQTTHRLRAAIHYHYRRVIEETQHAIYGNTDRQYIYLVNLGLYTGRAERFGETGYTSSDGPLLDAYRGLTLHLDITANRWTLHQQITATRRRGYFGEKSTTAICYSAHDGLHLAYHGRLHLPGTLDRSITWDITRETLDNRENLYRPETLPGNTSTIVYHGTVDVFTTTTTRALLAYHDTRGLVAGQPARARGITADYTTRRARVSLYPYYREQHLHLARLALSAARYLPAARDAATGLSLHLAAAAGSGNAARDGLYTTPSTGQTPPASADDLLHREHEYLTIPRLEATATLTRYTAPLPRGARAYARATITARHALTTPRYLDGRSTRDITIAIGYTF